MFGIPENLILAAMTGARLLQACFGANEVILMFDRELTITIEGDYEVRGSGSGRAAVQRDTGLLSLLSTTIRDARRVARKHSEADPRPARTRAYALVDYGAVGY